MTIDGSGEREASQTQAQEWWLAVRSIADLVSRSGVAPDEDRLIRRELADQGFSHEGIRKALAWVDHAALSGNLMDALGMLQPSPDRIRVEHPLERLSLSPDVARALESCRRQGIISHEMAERLIEGLRTMDARDWERDEVEALFADILNLSTSGLEGQVVSRILAGRNPKELN